MCVMDRKLPRNFLKYKKLDEQKVREREGSGANASDVEGQVVPESQPQGHDETPIVEEPEAEAHSRNRPSTHQTAGSSNAIDTRNSSPGPPNQGKKRRPRHVIRRKKKPLTFAQYVEISIREEQEKLQAPLRRLEAAKKRVNRRNYYGHLIHDRLLTWLKVKGRPGPSSRTAGPRLSTGTEDSYTTDTDDEGGGSSENPNRTGVSITVTEVDQEGSRPTLMLGSEKGSRKSLLDSLEKVEQWRASNSKSDPTESQTATPVQKGSLALKAGKYQSSPAISITSSAEPFQDEATRTRSSPKLEISQKGSPIPGPSQPGSSNKPIPKPEVIPKSSLKPGTSLQSSPAPGISSKLNPMPETNSKPIPKPATNSKPIINSKPSSTQGLSSKPSSARGLSSKPNLKPGSTVAQTGPNIGKSESSVKSSPKPVVSFSKTSRDGTEPKPETSLKSNPKPAASVQPTQRTKLIPNPSTITIPGSEVKPPSLFPTIKESSNEAGPTKRHVRIGKGTANLLHSVAAQLMNQKDIGTFLMKGKPVEPKPKPKPKPQRKESRTDSSSGSLFPASKKSSLMDLHRRISAVTIESRTSGSRVQPEDYKYENVESLIQARRESKFATIEKKLAAKRLQKLAEEGQKAQAEAQADPAAEPGPSTEPENPDPDPESKA